MKTSDLIEQLRAAVGEEIKMRILTLFLGVVLIAVGLASAVFLWSWVWSVLHYAPEARWLVFAGRATLTGAITLASVLVGWALIRVADALPKLERVKAHRAAKVKLAWDHVYRALVVGNPTSDLLTLIETAPPVAQYILDQAYEDGNPRRIHAGTVAFIQRHSKHGPLEPAPLPAIPPELLTPAIREACELYPK